MIRSSWKSGLALVRGLLLVAGCLLAGTAARADALTDAWAAAPCSGCHSTPVYATGNTTAQADDDYYRILTLTLLNPQLADSAIVTQMRQYCDAGHGGAGSYMCVNYSDYFKKSTFTTDAELKSVYYYLLAARQTLVSHTAIAFAGLTRRGTTSASTQNFTIKNYRSTAIDFTFTVSSEFPVTSSCGASLPATAGTDPGICTFTVGFAPSAAATVPARSSSIDFTFISTGPANRPPAPSPRSVAVSGTADVPPVVSAGAAQGVTTGNTVNLAGSATDANGQALTRNWTFLSRPAGSAAALTNPTSLTPSFVADVGGVYSLQLSVGDGTFTITATTTVTANTRPVANAGSPQSVLVPATVTLDGSLSADPDGNPITYLWSLSRPAGSSAVLSNATAQKPTFVADVGGPYSATLTVSDGSLTSTVSTVLVSANTRPVANAGSSQSVSTGALVQLNGSASVDADGDTLTYLWTLTKPAGSAAVLSSATSKTPTFVADIAGSYTAALKVNDGKVDSLATPASSVTITATVGNAPPIAHATAPATALVGATITFDGTTSTDADGDPLTYSWSLTRPAGSAAVLSSPTAAKPTLVADVAGTYTATLVVNDGTANSAVSASASVVVTLPSPAFTISTTSLPFSVAAGSSTTASAVIGNSGSAPLVLSALTFSGPQAAEFTLAPGNGCTAALSIPASGNCTLVVSFAPAVAGARTATLTIAHNAGGSPQTVTLQGTATAAPQGKIELSALTLAFPDTTVADSATLPITVRNTGNLALNFTAFAFGGAAAADFSRAGTCAVGTPLPIGADCTVDVSFRPTLAGPRVASLTIQSDASNGAATLALTGTALPVPAPVVTLTPSPTLDFQTQTVNGLYPARPVVLANTGNADLTVATIAVAGTGFAISGSSGCPTTLAAGASCTISVSFLATATADFTGTLRVTSNAAGSPHTVNLRGTGTTAAVPILRWSPAVSALDFGMVSSGALSATQSVMLHNDGPGGAQIAFVNAVGPDGFAFSVDPGTCPIGSPLFEGATCRIDIRFAPGSAGTKHASVQIASTGSAPPPLTLTGVGLSGPGPGLATSVGSLDLGSTSTGASSLPATVTISSNGSGVLNVASIEVMGPYAIQSTTCPAAPFVLNAGANCTVAIRFQPQTTGTTAGTLRITSDASPSVRDIALLGKGEAPTDVSSGGGGCTIAGSGGASLRDPTLWLLVLAALAVLAWRRRGQRGDRGEPT